MTTTPKESLLTFPCDFVIKVIGEDTDDFETAVLMLIREHVPQFSDCVIPSRPSKSGKYRALSITVHVSSQQQLDALYQALSSSTHVLMAL
jgi:putative lipoic acid-binding regulatory protein